MKPLFDRWNRAALTAVPLVWLLLVLPTVDVQGKGVCDSYCTCPGGTLLSCPKVKLRSAVTKLEASYRIPVCEECNPTEIDISDNELEVLEIPEMVHKTLVSLSVSNNPILDWTKFHLQKMPNIHTVLFDNIDMSDQDAVLKVRDSIRSRGGPRRVVILSFKYF